MLNVCNRKKVQTHFLIPSLSSLVSSIFVMLQALCALDCHTPLNQFADDVADKNMAFLNSGRID